MEDQIENYLEDEVETPMMPSFDRVRENYLKRVEQELKFFPSSPLTPWNNLFLTNIYRLGYHDSTIYQKLVLFCQQYPYELDGGVYSLDFIESFFQHISNTSSETDPVHGEPLPFIKRDSPFPWPLVDMAEYEFGSFGIENEIDMKKVVVVTGLPILPHIWVSRIQYLITELLLKRIGRSLSIYIPLSTQSSDQTNSFSTATKGTAFIELSRVSEAWLVYEALDGFCWPTGIGRPLEVISAMKIDIPETYSPWRVQILKNYGRFRDALELNIPSSTAASSSAATSATMTGVPNRNTETTQFNSSAIPETGYLSRIRNSLTNHIELSPSNGHDGGDDDGDVETGELSCHSEDDHEKEADDLYVSLPSNQQSISKLNPPKSHSRINRYNDRVYEPEAYQKEPSDDDGDQSEIEDSNILYGLENNLLSVKGELLREIGIDRSRDSREVDYHHEENSHSRNIYSTTNHESEVDNLIKEGKKWRRLEESLHAALSGRSVSQYLQSEYDNLEALTSYLPSREHYDSQSPQFSEISVPYDSLNQISSSIKYLLKPLRGSHDEDRHHSSKYSKLERKEQSIDNTSIHLQISTLKTLSLIAWIKTSEKKIKTLRRINRLKTNRLSECEDELQQALERSRKYNSQMQDLQSRVDQLTHSLAYHEHANDHMHVLESQLLQVERERIDLMRMVQEFERKAKLSNSQHQYHHQQQQQQQQQSYEESRERRGRRREVIEKYRKEETYHSSSLSSPPDSSSAEITQLISSIEQLNSLPIDSFTSLSLEQITSSQSHLHSLLRTFQHASDLIIQKQKDSNGNSQEQNYCCICQEQPKTILLLPCRHICLCEECSQNFNTGRLENCPVCRHRIVDILRVYI